jgi:hypothetical protein
LAYGRFMDRKEGQIFAAVHHGASHLLNYRPLASGSLPASGPAFQRPAGNRLYCEDGHSDCSVRPLEIARSGPSFG